MPGLRSGYVYYGRIIDLPSVLLQQDVVDPWSNTLHARFRRQNGDTWKNTRKGRKNSKPPFKEKCISSFKQDIQGL